MTWIIIIIVLALFGFILGVVASKIESLERRVQVLEDRDEL